MLKTEVAGFMGLFKAHADPRVGRGARIVGHFDNNSTLMKSAQTPPRRSALGENDAANEAFGRQPPVNRALTMRRDGGSLLFGHRPR